MGERHCFLLTAWWTRGPRRKSDWWYFTDRIRGHRGKRITEIIRWLDEEEVNYIINCMASMDEDHEHFRLYSVQIPDLAEAAKFRFNFPDCQLLDDVFGANAHFQDRILSPA